MEMPATPSGSTKEKKSPSIFRVKHADAPDLANAGPGDEVELHTKGHVVSNRAKDEFGDGEAEIQAHSVEHKGTKKKGVEKGKNAAHMPIDELKEVIKASQPKDKENDI
jgi:hypothetical protein